MVTTAPTLDTKHGPGVYRLDTTLPVSETSRLLEQLGFEVFAIDCSAISDKETFLRAAGDAMRFPDYYAANWDSFEECITDLAWTPARGYVLLLDQLDQFARQNPSQWEMAVDILRAAADHWKATDTPMYVLLRGPAPSVANLPALHFGQQSRPT